MANINRQLTLAARPVGLPRESDFKLIETPIPSPKPGEFVARTLYLSVDPYMRGRMNEGRSYADPVKLGEVMVGGTVGEVLESKHPAYRQGDIVVGYWGWQEYGVSDGQGISKVDPAIAPISTALGVLGMPGLTAYFGLLTICDPKPGETVVVSGAAGAVGSAVGQIAKIRGCRTVGIAGGAEKVRYISEELDFDAALDYKSTENYYSALKQLCPNGIDVYFDNVGGSISDAALGLINTKARISICGQISQYNLEKPELGPRPWPMLLVRQAKAEGFLVFQFADRYAEGLRELSGWVREGRLKYRETIAEGLESAPQAFIGMLQGRNIGKQLVRVS